MFLSSADSDLISCSSASAITSLPLIRFRLYPSAAWFPYCLQPFWFIVRATKSIWKDEERTAQTENARTIQWWIEAKWGEKGWNRMPVVRGWKRFLRSGGERGSFIDVKKLVAKFIHLASPFASPTLAILTLFHYPLEASFCWHSNNEQ